jgi:hypothetical protein
MSVKIVSGVNSLKKVTKTAIGRHKYCVVSYNFYSN